MDSLYGRISKTLLCPALVNLQFNNSQKVSIASHTIIKPFWIYVTTIQNRVFLYIPCPVSTIVVCKTLDSKGKIALKEHVTMHGVLVGISLNQACLFSRIMLQLQSHYAKKLKPHKDFPTGVVYIPFSKACFFLKSKLFHNSNKYNYLIESKMKHKRLFLEQLKLEKLVSLASNYR